MMSPPEPCATADDPAEVLGPSPEPEPCFIGPVPDQKQLGLGVGCPPQVLTLHDVSAVRRASGPYEDLDKRQLCLCCSCQGELTRLKARRCSRCKLAFYCSPECQKLYHKRHVRWCKAEATAQAQLREKYPAALVCSGSLVWHVRRWDARSKETCPDPRYYLQKTTATHPSYAAFVATDPAHLSPFWSFPRGEGAYHSEGSTSLLRVVGGVGGLAAATTAQLCNAALCLAAPSAASTVAVVDDQSADNAATPSPAALFAELIARIPGLPSVACLPPDQQPPPLAKCKYTLPPLPLPEGGELASLVGTLALANAQAVKCPPDQLSALSRRLCDGLAQAAAADAAEASPSSSTASPAAVNGCGECKTGRQLLVAARAEYWLGTQADTALEAEPHHRRAALYGNAPLCRPFLRQQLAGVADRLVCCTHVLLPLLHAARSSVGAYVLHLGADTLVSGLLDPLQPDGVRPWLVEGWWAALFEWGRNSFLVADFEEASRRD